MVDGVAHQVGQRVADGVEDAAVGLGVAAGDLEGDLPAAGGGQLAHQARQGGEEVVHRLHARAQDVVLEGAGDDVELLGQAGELVLGAGAGELADLVAQHDELAGLLHEPVEQVHPHAHGGVVGAGGRRGAARAGRTGRAGGVCGARGLSRA